MLREPAPTAVTEELGNWKRPALLAMLAVALRGWSAASQELIYNDGPRFLALARHLLDGNLQELLREDFHPLTALMIAGVSVVFGLELETAGRLVSVLSGGVAAWFLYRLAERGFGRTNATLATLLFAVHPRMLAIGSDVQSDGLHLALVMGGAWYAWRAIEDGRFRPALMTGLLCGLAYLTRPEGLIVGVVLALWILGDALARRIPLRRFLEAASGFAAPLLLIGGPYLVAMRIRHGSWALSQKKQLLPTLWPPPDLSQLAAALQEVLMDGLRAFHPLYLGLALLAFRRGRPSRNTLYLLTYAVVLLPVLLQVHLQSGYVSRRHWLVAVALLMPFVAAGALRAAAWIRAVLPPLRGRAWAPAAVLALLLVPLGVRPLLRQEEPPKLAAKRAGLWLRSARPDAVATRRARTAYYAGAQRHVRVRKVSELPALLEQLRAEDAGYLIIDGSRLPAAGSGDRTGLLEIHRVGYPGGHVAVFRVEAPGLAPSPVAAAAEAAEAAASAVPTAPPGSPLSP